MDIKITNTSLRNFLETPADVQTLSENISVCGPTFDRIHEVEGDYIFEIEAITNRVDTASAQGVAREAATILTQFGIAAKMVNDPYKEKINLYPNLPKQFHFNITETGLIERFTAVALSHVQLKPSPETVQKFLENCGERPINNLVDITNELTIMYGMPSHVFDLDKLAAQELTIRSSKPNEQVTTLDGKTNTLKGGDIVIEDAQGRLVDLCGVMGGQIAEVDNHTKNILLIVPSYHPKKVRHTSLYLQKRTLAAQLYEKQPDPELCLPVLTKAIELFSKRANAEVSSSVYDYYPQEHTPKIIPLNLPWLNSFVGVEIPKDQVIQILSGLGFSGTPTSQYDIECVVPSWRYHDINIKEDLAEEIARIYGYFRLPSVLPSVNTSTEIDNKLLSSELKAKKYLANIGYHEIYNNSLISEELIAKTSLQTSDHLKLQNALSADYEYLRTTLVPSLLQNLKNNQGKTDKHTSIFEIANIYLNDTKDALPSEVSTLCMLSTIDFLRVKGDLEALLHHMNIHTLSITANNTESQLFSQGKCALITNSNEQILGYIGEIKTPILRDLGITSNPTIIEINFSKLVNNISLGYTYSPISEYPSVVESVTIKTDMFIGDIIRKIKSIHPLIKEVVYTGSFKNKHTFKVVFGASDRNLAQQEVNAIKDSIFNTFSE